MTTNNYKIISAKIKVYEINHGNKREKINSAWTITEGFIKEVII